MQPGSETSFCLLDFNWLGFDLDHTLLRYKLPALYQLVYECLWEYLIVHKSYYPEHLKKLPFNTKFLQKGIIIDKELGNDRSIHQAYHGTRCLTREQINNQYPNMSIPFDGFTTPRFWSLTTYFETSFASIFLHLVDWLDQTSPTVPAYDTHCQRIYDGVFWNFAEWSQGKYFREIEKDPLKYVYPSTESRAWLVEAREKGLKLFLATNSFAEYTNLLMNVSYGSGWEALFDIVIYVARKPGFWTSPQECWEVRHNGTSFDKGWEYTLTTEMRLGGHYRQGNINMLLPVTQKVSNTPTPKICYFGDHIVYDVVVPRRTQLFAVAIVEEMEHDHESHQNEYWGSFFNCDGKESWWHVHHREHANLSIPSIAYLAKFPITYRHPMIKSYRLQPHDI